MAFFNVLRKILKRKRAAQSVEYVREDRSSVDSNDSMTHWPSDHLPNEHDIDLSHQADLEGYARDLSVSKESIERWISSGLLMPDEMKVAEKLIKIMNKH